jgi:hypothetical protein
MVGGSGIFAMAIDALSEPDDFDTTKVADTTTDKLHSDNLMHTPARGDCWLTRTVDDLYLRRLRMY